MKLINVFAALLITLPLPVSATNYEPMEHRTFEHDGVEREYFVHVPDDASGKLPVVLAIHGYTSTATGFAVFHDLNSHADKKGYIVVYPQGSHFVAEDSERPYRATSWNFFVGDTPDPEAGPQCSADAHHYPCAPECGVCDRCDWTSCYNDMGYFEKLLDAIESEFDTDTSRYYALGMSNGGMMTLRLGCNMSSHFAAIAPIAAQLPAGFNCAPTTDLPMIHLGGGKDNTVRIDGGINGDGFFYVSVTELAADWAEALHCESGPGEWETELTNKAELSCMAYSSCKVRGHEVVSCVDPDETHNWPARRPGGAWPTCVTHQQYETMPEQRHCEPRTESGPHVGMDIIWSFFERYRRD